MQKTTLVLAAALTMGIGQTFVGAQGQGNGNANGRAKQAQPSQDKTRFDGMDRNNDGRITRAEWRGSDQAFREHDWNNDGVLTGDEVRPGANPYDPSRDRNADNRDWFAWMDLNGDHRISRSEWTGTVVQFDRLDVNADNYLTRSERLGTEVPDVFTSLDKNRDRAVSRSEWPSNLGDFSRIDANHDNRVTREELLNPRSPSSQNSAYQAGFQRGQTEGRQAGLEDRTNKYGWDLEGQRELEQADSGYNSSIGPRADYQAGYRDGFRRAYPVGFRG